MITTTDTVIRKQDDASTIAQNLLHSHHQEGEISDQKIDNVDSSKRLIGNRVDQKEGNEENQSVGSAVHENNNADNEKNDSNVASQKAEAISILKKLHQKMKQNYEIEKINLIHKHAKKFVELNCKINELNEMNRKLQEDNISLKAMYEQNISIHEEKEQELLNKISTLETALFNIGSTNGNGSCSNNVKNDDINEKGDNGSSSDDNDNSSHTNTAGTDDGVPATARERKLVRKISVLERTLFNINNTYTDEYIPNGEAEGIAASETPLAVSTTMTPVRTKTHEREQELLDKISALETALFYTYGKDATSSTNNGSDAHVNDNHRREIEELTAKISALEAALF